jgi:hypothetical protein
VAELTELHRIKIDIIKRVIGHLHNFSDEQFLVDNDPDHEILVWGTIADAYTEEMKVRDKLRKVSMEEQKLLFQVLLTTSVEECAPDELPHILPEALSLKNFRTVVGRYYKLRLQRAGL